MNTKYPIHQNTAISGLWPSDCGFCGPQHRFVARMSLRPRFPGDFSSGKSCLARNEPPTILIGTHLPAPPAPHPPSHFFAITVTDPGHCKLTELTRKKGTDKILLMDVFVHKKNSHLPSHVLSWIPLSLLLKLLLCLRMSVCAIWQRFSVVIAFCFAKNLYNSELPQHFCVNQGHSRQKSDLDIYQPALVLSPLAYEVNFWLVQKNKQKKQNRPKITTLKMIPFFASIVSYLWISERKSH